MGVGGNAFFPGWHPVRKSKVINVNMAFPFIDVFSFVDGLIPNGLFRVY
jgi:hypothetical protein